MGRVSSSSGGVLPLNPLMENKTTKWISIYSYRCWTNYRRLWVVSTNRNSRGRQTRVGDKGRVNGERGRGRLVSGLTSLRPKETRSCLVSFWINRLVLRVRTGDATRWKQEVDWFRMCTYFRVRFIPSERGVQWNWRLEPSVPNSWMICGPTNYREHKLTKEWETYRKIWMSLIRQTTKINKEFNISIRTEWKMNSLLCLIKDNVNLEWQLIPQLMSHPRNVGLTILLINLVNNRI